MKKRLGLLLNAGWNLGACDVKLGYDREGNGARPKYDKDLRQFVDAFDEILPMFSIWLQQSKSKHF